jgi:hypothetical protein
MTSITTSKTHVMQMKGDFKIKQIKKNAILDFMVHMKGGLKILFTVKGRDEYVIMRFPNMELLEQAIEALIIITNKLKI